LTEPLDERILKTWRIDREIVGAES